MTRRPSMRLCLIPVCILIAATLAGCPPTLDCSAPEFLVTKFNDTNDGVCIEDDCSLREAIQSANLCPGPDVIRLPAGTYSLSIFGADEDGSDTGDLDISDDVTIIGEGTPVIDAQGIDRVFHITDAANVTMEGLIIRGGEVEIGGGIFNEGMLVIENTEISENSAEVGGGIAVFGTGTLLRTGVDTIIQDNFASINGGGLAALGGAQIELTDARIRRNYARYNGGGIYNEDSLTANQVRIAHNTTNIGQGGGIYNEGDVLLEETVISTNGKFGIYNQGTSLELVDCIVDGNEGGGIISFKSSSPLVPVTLTNTQIINNDGDGFNGINTDLIITGGSISDNQGHGVSNMTSLTMSGTTVSGNTWSEDGGGLNLVNIISATIENSTISDNGTFGDGGGIYYWGMGGIGGTLSLINVTVSGNHADGDGGGIIIASNTPSIIELHSVTLSGNWAGESGQSIYNNGGVVLHNTIIENPYADNCAGSASDVFSYGYNISSDTTCLSGGTDDLLSTDALLEPLANNGGGTRTHALVPESPAVDSADPGNCPGTDQRGISRPLGDGCDRGAYELEEFTISRPDIEPPLIDIQINFNADEYSIAKGDCTILRWQVDNASDVFLEGEQVEIIGAQKVCPTKTTTYEMRVPSDDEELQAKVTIEVTEAPSPPAAPTGLQVTNSACVQDYTVTLTWTDQADNESGYRVYRDGILIATLPANSTSYVDTPPAPDSHIYAVEAVNEAGSSAQISITQPEICPT